MNGIAESVKDKFLHWEEFDFDNPKFNYLFSVMPNAAAAFDENICYLAVSTLWCEAYNLSEDNIIGKSHYEIFPEIPERWKDFHQRALNGEALICKKDPFIRRDGHIDWIDWELLPLIDVKKNIRGFVLFTTVTPQET